MSIAKSIKYGSQRITSHSAHSSKVVWEEKFRFAVLGGSTMSSFSNDIVACTCYEKRFKLFVGFFACKKWTTDKFFFLKIYVFNYNHCKFLPSTLKNSKRTDCNFFWKFAHIYVSYRMEITAFQYNFTS